MLLRILLFAGAKARVGRDSLSLDVPPGTTVSELRQIVTAAHPALVEVLPHCRFAVNSQYAGNADVIPPAAEIAVIPPVSGG